MIKHLVFSGSGPNGIVQAGILKEFVRRGLVERKNLTRVYGTSAGAILIYLLLLDIPIDALCAYFIERPWEKVFKADLMAFAETKGMMPTEAIEAIYMPFLNAMDVPATLTFAELFERTKVEFNVFVTELEDLESVVLNHLTFPDMPVATALTMSSSIPPVFAPVPYQGKQYLDGGLSNNFPVLACLQAGNDPAEVLGIHICGLDLRNETALDFAKNVVCKMIDRVMLTDVNTDAANQCRYFIHYKARSLVDPDLWSDFLASVANRREMLRAGEAFTATYLDLKVASSICA